MMLSLLKPGPRKEAIIGLVPEVSVAAEIGADHGQISAGVLAAGRAQKMLVCDVSAASLVKARRLFASLGWETRAEFYVADGLDGLNEPVGAIIVAGMGAKTMEGILERGREKLRGAKLILQPNPGVQHMRTWLSENGWRIEKETLVFDEGRYYVALRAAEGNEALSLQQIWLGPRLLEAPTPLFGQYARHRLACARMERGEGAAEKIAMLEETVKELQAHGM